MSIAPHVDPATLPADAHIVLLPLYLSTFTLTGAAADTLSREDRTALLSCLEAHRGAPVSRLLLAVLALLDERDHFADPTRATVLQLMRAWSRRDRQSPALICSLIKALAALAKTQQQTASLRVLLRQLTESFEDEDAYRSVPPAIGSYFSALEVHTRVRASASGAHIQYRLQETSDDDLPRRQAWQGLSMLTPATDLLDSEQLDEIAEALTQRASMPVIARGLAFGCGLHLTPSEPERTAAIRFVLLGAFCVACVVETGHPATRAYAGALRALTEDTPLEPQLVSFAKSMVTRPSIAKAD